MIYKLLYFHLFWQNQ